SGFLKSDSAISAAFFSDVPTPAPLGPDSGRIRPTRTWPWPICAPGPGAGGAVGDVLPNLPKSPRSNLLSAQADSASAVLAHKAPRSTPLRVSNPLGLRGVPDIVPHGDRLGC